jgi:hypothetical protein
MCRMVIRILLVCNLLLYFTPPPVWGQNSPEPPPDSKKLQEGGDVAEKINNPVSDLWLLSVQNGLTWYNGEITDKNRLLNLTLLQPVLSMQFTEKWRIIVRPVIPIASFPFSGFDYEEGPKGPIPKPDFGRHSGLGDMVLWTAFTNKYTPPNVFGFGPTLMLPTGTYRTLTTGKFCTGPMALAFHTGRKWIIGTVMQHWWSVAGDDKRTPVSLTDIQYVLRYRLTPATSIGFGPNIRINWMADSRDRLSFPIGFGGATLIKLGPLPVRVGTEFQWYPVTPEIAGPKYSLMLSFVPVIPAPAWSKEPLLNF